MLNIEYGRHLNIVRNERKCILCNKNEIEDEFHFVLICPLFEVIRRKYINKHFYIKPNMFKFVQLLNSDNENVLKKLSLFCKHAFKLRLDTLNNNT